jgi:hypothetical protein
MPLLLLLLSSHAYTTLRAPGVRHRAGVPRAAATLSPRVLEEAAALRDPPTQQPYDYARCSASGESSSKAPRPRAHQRDALDAIGRHYAGGDGAAAPVDGDDGAAAFDDGARATVVLPPGAGKTLIGMWALERELRAGEAGLVVLPTLPLVDQARARHVHAAACLAV